MKTVEKLRWIFAICFCMLLYILFFSNHDRGSEIKKKLEYEEMIWKQRHMNLDGVKWDSVVHFQNGRYEVGKFHQVSKTTESVVGRKVQKYLLVFCGFYF